jgi:hypothetical protein
LQQFPPTQIGGGLGKGMGGAERFLVTRFAYRLSGLRHFARNRRAQKTQNTT